jgi:hypothetical protein
LLNSNFFNHQRSFSHRIFFFPPPHLFNRFQRLYSPLLVFDIESNDR